MIRHGIAAADLINRINAAKPNWMARARQRTSEYAKAGSFTGGSEFWGEIKRVYIALLVYPISNIDEDPSKLIGFDGVLAVPRRRTGFAYARANVTITFFQLNHQDLTTRRAQRLWPLFVSLEARAVGAPSSLLRDAQSAIQLACGQGAEFSACMSSFVQLHAKNRVGARQRAEAARGLI